MFGRKSKSGTGDRESGSAPPVGQNTDNNRVMLLLADDYLKERRARRRWGLVFKFLVLGYIAVTTYAWFQAADTEETAAHTAVVEIDGLIGPDSLSASIVNSSLADAFKASSSMGVIIKINSPGGTPVQAAQINEEIWRLKTEYPDKPVYAAVTDICASGGYYVAVAADQIYAHPSSIIGSIGVLMNGFGFVGAMEKLGIDRRLMTAGDNKGMLDPFSPVDPGQQRHAQVLIDEVHQQFIDAVRRGRGDRLRDNGELFSGLIWSGESAMELGLVDNFGSVEQIAREVIGAENLVDYTYRPSFFEQFTREIGVSMVQSLLNQFVQLR